MTASASRAGVGRVAGAAALIAVLTVFARLAGFGRTAVFTWVVQRTDLGDLYLLANTVPNIVFEIVAGGALASLVVPLLAGAVAAGDRRTVAATTGALLTWTVTLLVPLAVAVAVFAEPIITLFAADPDPTQVALGGRMLRVFAPQLPLYGVGIVLTGVLQAHRRFAWPVIAPLLSSVTVIIAYLSFAVVQGRGVTIAAVDRTGELILSVGTTLGVVVLSLSLLVPLRRLRLRMRPGYALDPDARRRLPGLAMAGAVTVLGQQIALLVTLKLANGGPDGSVVVYNLAQTMYLLPWAVLAVPLAVAAYPTLTAAHAVGDDDTYRRTLAPTVRAVVLFSALGAAALVATAGPVARFFFGADDTGAVVAGIAGFAPGLLGYGLFAVLSRALYARELTRSAAVATGVGWLAVPVAAVGLATALPGGQRVLALTLANSAGMLVLGAALIVVVGRRAGPVALSGFGRAGLAAVLAGGLAAVAGAAVAGWLSDGTPTKPEALVQGMLSAGVAGAVFLGVAYPLDRADVGPAVAGLVRRLRRIDRRRAPHHPRPHGADPDRDGVGQDRGERPGAGR